MRIPTTLTAKQLTSMLVAYKATHLTSQEEANAIDDLAHRIRLHCEADQKIDIVAIDK